MAVNFPGWIGTPETCWQGPTIFPADGAVGNYVTAGDLLAVQAPPWILRVGDERQGSIYILPNDGPERTNTVVFQVALSDMVSQCSVVVRQAAGTVTVPNPPVLFSPGDASSPGPMISTLTPTMSWSQVSGATGYGLYVRDLVTDTLVYDNDLVPNVTSLPLPPSTLTAGHNYRWNMRASNSAGFGGFSARLYFQVVPAPRLISPMIVPGAAFQFGTVGVTNQTCVIEASADLLNWVRAGTNSSSSGSFIFSDARATNLAARFYRVAVLP
jgi:hypothetical protein